MGSAQRFIQKSLLTVTALLSIAGFAEAAIITTTASGTILQVSVSSGYAEQFGPIAPTVGDEFAVTFVFDTSVGGTHNPQHISGGAAYGLQSLGAAALTINGYTLIIDGSYMSAVLTGAGTLVYSVNDYPGSSLSLHAQDPAIHLGWTPFMPATLENANVYGFFQSSGLGFNLTGTHLTTSFTGAPEYPTGSVSYVGNVPETSTWVMLILGFVCLGGVKLLSPATSGRCRLRSDLGRA